MNPFYLKPAFKEYPWGGEKLKTLFHKQSSCVPLAESWELSAHPHGDCVVADGVYAGIPFSQFVRDFPDLMGYDYSVGEEFPLMIKLIDARECLSVQVHPDDAYGARVEQSRGKTEMWYILDCEPEAFIYLGLEHSISTEEFRRHIEEETLTEVLHKIYVHPGDVVFVEAGTIHALGAGILVAEVQQNSNITYRVYDYGRKWNGTSRELHVDKALEVSSLGPARRRAYLPGGGIPKEKGEIVSLVQCPYFVVKGLRNQGQTAINLNGKSFLSLVCIDGQGIARTPDGWEGALEKGDSLFVPSNSGLLTLLGELEVLLTFQGDLYR